MKRIILLIILSYCFLQISRAQALTSSHNQRDANEKVIIDNSKLKVTYRARISIDTLGDHYYDNQILEIGEKHNRYYSAFAEDMDSIAWEARREPIKTMTDEGYYPRENLKFDEDGTYEDIFINYPKPNMMTIYNKFYLKLYVYKEPILNFEWNITENKEKILGYECIEATTRFRGRDYRVWFTIDIPYNFGPWKFSGLPGLILKAEDTKGLYKFIAIGVEQPIDGKIYLYDSEAKKCKRKDVLKLNDLRWQNYVLLGKTNGVKGFIHVERNTNTGQLEEVDYKPNGALYIPQMELE